MCTKDEGNCFSGTELVGKLNNDCQRKSKQKIQLNNENIIDFQGRATPV